MFDNLKSTSVEDASQEDVLAAMGGDPAEKAKGTGDKKSSGGLGDKKPVAKTTKSESKPGTSTAKNVVSELDKDDLDEAFPSNEEEENEGEEKDDVKPGKVKKEEKDEEEEDEKDESEEDKDEDETDKGEDDDDAPVSVSDFLKARVELLLKKGGWRPFEFDGKKPDEIEWDEETFEEIELQQRAWEKDSLKEELLDGFGPYGRDIAEYAQNGGNPEDLIDIFKEQQQVKAIDISSEDGQKEIVFQYQTQILKRTPQRANKEIERLIADKMLEDDAKEAKETIETHLKEQADDMKAEAEATKKNFELQTKATQKKFSEDVTKLVNDADDIPVEEKKEVIKLLTSFRHELSNGTKVNDFYFKLAEFRKDLKNYVNMVRFVNNPSRFMKSLTNVGKTAEAEKSFKLARGSQDKKKAKPSSEIGGDRSPKKGTGFKLM